MAEICQRESIAMVDILTLCCSSLSYIDAFPLSMTIHISIANKRRLKSTRSFSANRNQVDQHTDSSIAQVIFYLLCLLTSFNPPSPLSLSGSSFPHCYLHELTLPPGRSAPSVTERSKIRSQRSNTSPSGLL